MTKRSVHLRITPRTGDHGELGAFLRGAILYYEALPGVRVRLLRNVEEPSRYIEVIEYDTVAAFDADEARISGDPHMQTLLQAWRETLDGEAIVETYEDVTEAL